MRQYLLPYIDHMENIYKCLEILTDLHHREDGTCLYNGLFQYV